MLVNRASVRAFARLRWLTIFAGLALAACQTDDSLVTGSVGASGPRTIAFESIDGPPPPVFKRLVAQLSSEAETRKLPVISRNNTASLRVRFYLAAHSQKHQAGISWVGDVYDARYDRAFRVSGEEPIAASKKDLWSYADDALLARIAANSLDAIMKGPQNNEPAASPPAAEPHDGQPVASIAPVATPSAFAEMRN